MNRDQFIRALRSYSKANGLGQVRLDLSKGRGGHGRVWVGDRFTTIPSGELKKGTKEGILKQLGLPKEAL